MHQKNYFVTLVKTNYIKGHITENKSFQITKVLRTLELLIVTEVFKCPLFGEAGQTNC